MRTATFTITAYTGPGRLVVANVITDVLSYSINIPGGILTLFKAGNDRPFEFSLVDVDTFVVSVESDGSQTITMNSYYDTKVADSDPDHYWRLNESAGTTATDSADGMDGTISGGVTLGATGFVNNDDTSADFDGVDGTIDMDSVAIVAPMTVEAWFNCADAANFPMLWSYSDQGDNDHFCQVYFAVDPAEVTEAGNYLTLDYSMDGINENFQYVNYQFLENTPYYVVIVIGPRGNKAYVNGVSVGFATQDPPEVTLPLTDLDLTFHIGSDDGAGFFWTGTIGEVAKYSFELSPNEIANHYNGIK
jgi:hypothetical protein